MTIVWPLGTPGERYLHGARCIDTDDVMYLLNRYFARVGELIERNDGYIDKFVGDGLMAIFGVGGQPDAPILSVNAALQTLAAVDRMKPFFASMYGIDFDIRMVCIGAKAADPEAMMDAGLGGMKAALKLTPDQNPLWEAFENAVRGAGKARMDDMRQMMENRERMSSVERMDATAGHNGSTRR